jgi:hypothetical protein
MNDDTEALIAETAEAFRRLEESAARARNAFEQFHLAMGKAREQFEQLAGLLSPEAQARAQAGARGILDGMGTVEAPSSLAEILKETEADGERANS